MPVPPSRPGRRRSSVPFLLAFAAVTWGGAPRLVAAPQGEAFGPQQEDVIEGRKVVSIVVEGERRYSEEKLIAALGLRPGLPYESKVVRDGIGDLWKLFQVRARVDYQIVEEGVVLRLVVTELPVDLEPRFIGNDKIKLKDILEWGQLEDRRELYIHQVGRVTTRILEGYKRKGYYFAQVRPVVREVEGIADEQVGDVIFEIIEGPQVNVKKVVVHGNVSLPDRGALFWKDGLSKLSGIQLAGPSLFDWNGKEFVEETLRADLLAMRNVYRDRGYLNAVVDLDDLEFSENRSRVIVHVVVDEGEPFVVTGVSIRAFDLQEHPRGQAYLPVELPVELLHAEDTLKSQLTLTPGKIYERRWIDADRVSLRDFYGRFGHIEHGTLGLTYSWRWLEPELVYDLDKAEVEVIYRIAQGQPVKIREIKIAGATHTLDRVIRREISVEPGELADMKEILGSVRRLTSTGYFSDDRNRLEHRDPTFRFIPTEEPGQVDIEFIVEEGRVVDFAISGGIDSNTGLFGLISLTMNNFDVLDIPDSFLGSFGEIYRKEAFHGAGQTLRIVLSPGVERDQAELRFIEPDIFKKHKNRIAFDGRLARYDNFFEDFDQAQTIRSVSFGRQLGYNSRLWVGFTSRDVTIDNVDPDVDLTDPELRPLAEQVGTSSLNAITMSANHRDTDAAFNPKDGIVLSVDTELHAKQIGSDWEYTQATISLDEYWMVGPETSEVRPGFRLATAAGISVPFGSTDFTPYSERYFLGGYNSLRGFRFRGVGPYSQSGVPIGGENMIRASLEFRYPIYSITQPGTYRKLEMLRFQVFVDSGVLGPQYDRLDPDETRVAAGFGFGLTHPFPLVFDFAWPLKSEDADRTQVFSFNLAVR